MTSKKQETMGNAFGDGRCALPEEEPVGYKRTEVGVIPEEWSFQQLETICDVRDGTHESPQFYSEGVPLVTSKNIVNGSLDIENTSCISNQDADRINKRSKVDLNDILMSMIGTIGSTVLIDFEPDFCIKNVALIKPQKVLPTYLIHLMASPFFQTYLEDSLDGGIQKFIALGTLRHLNIPLPPSTEQRAIAEVLSDVDELLSALEELIAKKQAVRQAAMQQLLTGKTRLPGFSGKWTEKPLIELATITMGQSPPSMFYNLRREGLPLIQGNADIEGRRTIDRVWTTRGSKYCDSGDLLLTVRAPVGAVAFASRKACLGRGVCGLKSIDNSAFLFHALVHAESRWQILEQGSTFTAANSEQVGQFRLCIPSDENEQSAIANVLSYMDAEIAALEQRRDKARAIKQGMMQELLTGRVRLV